MISIIFSDNIKNKYKSFEEILKLDNYNDINYIDCAYNKLSNLPELPNSLVELHCNNNKFSILPELPNSLIHLNCEYNNLSSLPELPNSLKGLKCFDNDLSNLPELPNSLLKISFNYNPIHTYIKIYFDGKRQQYFEYQRQIKRIFVNKIGNWFLDCKYNPKYLYCKKRLMKEYDELYN